MKRFNLLTLIIILATLTGCGDPYEKYYGTWEAIEQGEKGHNHGEVYAKYGNHPNIIYRIVKIERDGEAIIFEPSELSISTVDKEKKANRLPLIEKDGKLFFSRNGILGKRSVQFFILENGNLKMRKDEFKKVNQNDLEVIKKSLRKKAQEYKKLDKKCEVLHKEYSEKLKKTKDKSNLNKEYEKKKKEITDCSFILYNMPSF